MTCNITGQTMEQSIEEAIIAVRPSGTLRRVAAGGKWSRKEEPKWYVDHSFRRVCQAAGFSNLADIENSFSAGYGVFIYLPVFRNYYAHRNEETLRKVQSIAPHYGIPATRRPSLILLTPPIHRPQPLILEWLDELTFTADYLCH